MIAGQRTMICVSVLLLVGMFTLESQGQMKVSAGTVRSVKASHPAAVRVQKALEAGEAFEADSFILNTSGTTDKTPAEKKQLAGASKQFKDTLADAPKFIFVEGVDVRGIVLGTPRAA